MMLLITHEDRAHDFRACAGRACSSNLPHRADLAHKAVAHHHDAVGERERSLPDPLRDVDRRRADQIVDAAGSSARISSRSSGVEIGERLVHQNQRRLDHDRARDGDALLLAAGQLAGQLFRLIRVSRTMLSASLTLRARSQPWDRAPASSNRNSTSAPHAHMRKQRSAILEHHAEAAQFSRVIVIDPRLV